ncbi:DUF7504 family protein [Halomarina litorea]|uniref:DUF7504 family protein n=1 Tax=Halomarina litorea TaxID=2961595 RepID=UPI0020C580A3|nr:hypothetical protein [Halomarina sp. BCD28]
MATNSRSGVFAQALAGLKRRGSGLLVVGAACSETHVGVCRRLLGDAASSDRRRLVVLTDGVPGAGARTDGGDQTTLQVIDRRPTTRGATSAATGSSSVSSDLETLRREVVAAVESFEREAGDLAPAELRVCVDSLRALVDGHGEAEVRTFLASVVEETRSRGGMCHVHLPASADSEAVERFADLFDATVEVRAVDREVDEHAVDLHGPVAVEQRWHLREEDIETDWLPL